MCDTTVGAYKAIKVIKMIIIHCNDDIVPRDRKISVFFFLNKTTT